MEESLLGRPLTVSIHTLHRNRSEWERHVSESVVATYFHSGTVWAHL